MRPAARPALAAALLLSCAAAERAAGQALPVEQIPWPFAPLLGTGRYEIADDAVVQSLSFAPRRRFGAGERGTDGRRRVGIELRVPLAVSTYRTDLTDLRSFTLDDVGTVAAVPGVEIDVPVSARLHVKPLVYAGLGKEFHGGPTASIYWAGVKARVSWQPGDLGVNLVTSLRHAGYRTSRGISGDAVPLGVGVEIRKPLGDATIGGDPLDWHWHVLHTHYLDDDVGSAPGRSLVVDDEWEIGIAFGKRDGRLRLGRLGWDRVGVALTLDSSGEPSGFRLIFRSLYDR